MPSGRIVSSAAAWVAAPLVERYIVAHRDRLESRGVPLSDEEMNRFSRYFESADLARVRVVVADPLPVFDPPFSGVLRRFGFHFPALMMTAAMTFDHVIAAREPMPPRMLFHELVHSVQYRLLGTRAFARCYTRGFLATREYLEIPLERCAFELDARFAQAGEVFRVEQEISRWIADGRF